MYSDIIITIIIIIMPMPHSLRFEYIFSVYKHKKVIVGYRETYY